MNKLVSIGVPCFQGSCSEIYLERAFKEDNSRPITRLGTARQLGETSVAFLIHPTIDDTTMAEIAAATAEIFRKAARNA